MKYNHKQIEFPTGNPTVMNQIEKAILTEKEAKDLSLKELLCLANEFKTHEKAFWSLYEIAVTEIYEREEKIREAEEELKEGRCD